MAKKAIPNKDFFDRLRTEVEKALADFPEQAAIIERDYRGFKFDVLSVRVPKEPTEGKSGILSEPTYYER